MTKIELSYFNIEGAGEKVRLALALAEQPFEDVRVSFPEWTDLKPNTPYGQLPIMSVDDGPLKTQSDAMLRWVGATFTSKRNLYPTDKLFEIEEVLGVIGDIASSWSPNIYISMRPQVYGYPEGYSKTDEGMEKIKTMRTTWIKEQLPVMLKRLEDLIDKSGGKWLVAGCDEPTIADCVAVSTLRSFTKGHIDHVDPKCLEISPKVVDYLKRFCDLPQIKGRYTDGIGSDAY